MSNPDVPTEPAVQPVRIVSAHEPSSPAPVIIAWLWAAVAVIVAIVLIAGAQDESYGGDAYTGMQNAVMLAVRGIAFLLIGSAALGLIVAHKRDGR